MESGEPDDAELLARHSTGDPSAFTTLVARHRDRAWSVALRTMGNPDDAADAVQDAFLSAYRTAATFRGDAQFSTWLHRIVINACLDRLRRARTRATVPLDATTRELADPRDALAESETANDVSAALARLNPDQRVAIVLVDLHGLPVEQAADVLGIPSGTVKSRCARGRAQLAVHLGHLRPDRVPAGTADGDRAPNPRQAPDE